MDRVEVGISGDAHAGLVALPELVVLLYLYVECGPAPEARVASLPVEIEPQVAGLKVGAILAARAADGEHGGREAVKPAPEKLNAGAAAAADASGHDPALADDDPGRAQARGGGLEQVVHRAIEEPGGPPR